MNSGDILLNFWSQFIRVIFSNDKCFIIIVVLYDFFFSFHPAMMTLFFITQSAYLQFNTPCFISYLRAYLNFLEASKLNHQQAKEYVAFGYLFGDYLPQNVTKAAQLFEELASRGSPRAQMVKLKLKTGMLFL